MANTTFSSADVLLPKTGFEKWAVIACDQYTSEGEYWTDVENIVGNSPSALRVILPEVYLSDDNSDKIKKINDTMNMYLESDVFSEYKDTLIYVERIDSVGNVRKGIVGKIDLEEYDYTPKSKLSVRATEQTVLPRIPPRVEIRKDAPLELPHVMLLIDDDKKEIIESLSESKDKFECLYDFTLMKNGGKISGYKIDKETEKEILNGLDKLKEKHNGLLFCVGDGNHSLATAKECYKLNKHKQSRYALAEIVNIHDSSLQFEPIYRVVFGVDGNKVIDEFVKSCGGEYIGEDAQKYICVIGKERREISVKPTSKLCVGTLQQFLDEYVKNHKDVKVDYIHGINSVEKLCEKEDTVGFIFDGMRKDELFDAVFCDGSLPRKTFSMGHADDKRFYIEARRLK